MTSSCQTPCVSAGFRAFTVTGCSFIWVTVGSCVAAEMETLLPDVLLRCASAGYCQYVVIALLFVVVNVAVWRCWMSFWLQSLLPLENHKSHSSSTAEVLLEPLGASWDCIHLFDMISSGADLLIIWMLLGCGGRCCWLYLSMDRVLELYLFFFRFVVWLCAETVSHQRQ